ncbi:MAG: Smr/MutS family protein [Bacteroidota bacterium]
MFRVGDQVEFLNEVGGGTVVSVKDQIVSIEDVDGFIYDYPQSELILKKEWNPSLPENTERKIDPNRVPDETDGYRLIHGKTPSMEVDLHIHMVIDQTRHLSNHEMVILQLRHFEKTLAEARRKKLTKIVYIHGIGKGRLRNELRKRLKSLSNCEFEDANYSKYGLGATEVKLWYN